MNPQTIKDADGRAIKNLSLINPADWAFSWSGNNASLTTPANAYSKVGWFRRAVEIRGNAVASTPWTISTSGDPDNVVWKSGETPPPKYAYFNTLPISLYLTEVSLTLEAGAFFLKVNEGRGFAGLQYFIPTTIEPVKTPQGLEAWERTVNGRKYKYAPEDVLAILTPNPYAESAPKQSERMSEAQAALVHADILESIDDFTRKSLDKGLIRPVLVGVPAGTGETERQRIGAWLKDKFGGAKKAGQYGIIESGALDIKELGEGISALAADELTQIHRGGIGTTLGVPHSMLQSRDAANRSVSEQDVRNFYTNTIIPHERLIEMEFNRQVFAELGLEFSFHPERVEAFQAAELEKAQGLSVLVERRIMTPNEARATLELDPVDGGDELQIPAMPMLQIDASRNMRKLEEREVANWRKIAGRNRDARFECKYLTPMQEGVIRERLAGPMPLDEVFAPPFVEA